jgi:cytochrome c oxidase subunit II
MSSSSYYAERCNDREVRVVTVQESRDVSEVAARTERRWATISVIIVIAVTLLAAIAGIHQASMPQARVETIDPSRLHLSGEFVESNLGSVLQPDGSVTVRAIGQQYSFTPACILVPAQTPITLRATSADVVHGIYIQATNINTMLVPATCRSSSCGSGRPVTI